MSKQVKKTNNAEIKLLDIFDGINILRAKFYNKKNTIGFFDMELYKGGSAIVIYGCTLMQTNDGKNLFVNLPSKKVDKDYYNIVYFKNINSEQVIDALEKQTDWFE